MAIVIHDRKPLIGGWSSPQIVQPAPSEISCDVTARLTRAPHVQSTGLTGPEHTSGKAWLFQGHQTDTYRQRRHVSEKNRDDARDT